jgi:hypothetical protein
LTFKSFKLLLTFAKVIFHTHNLKGTIIARILGLGKNRASRKKLKLLQTT